MSKYIVEIEEKPLCVFDKDTQTYFPRLWRVKGFNSLVFDEEGLSRLEELNSDYISEHYGELQDEAYRRGLEDGKWKAEDGCDGCKYYEDTSLTNPCSECSRGHVDHYKPVSDPDPIKVGDKVIVPSNSHIEPGELLSIVNGVCYIIWEDKTVSGYEISGVRRCTE